MMSDFRAMRHRKSMSTSALAASIDRLALTNEVNAEAGSSRTSVLQPPSLLGRDRKKASTRDISGAAGETNGLDVFSSRSALPSSRSSRFLPPPAVAAVGASNESLDERRSALKRSSTVRQLARSETPRDDAEGPSSRRDQETPRRRLSTRPPSLTSERSAGGATDGGNNEMRGEWRMPLPAQASADYKEQSSSRIRKSSTSADLARYIPGSGSFASTASVASYESNLNAARSRRNLTAPDQAEDPSTSSSAPNLPPLTRSAHRTSQRRSEDDGRTETVRMLRKYTPTEAQLAEMTMDKAIRAVYSLSSSHQSRHLALSYLERSLFRVCAAKRPTSELEVVSGLIEYLGRNVHQPLLQLFPRLVMAIEQHSRSFDLSGGDRASLAAMRELQETLLDLSLTLSLLTGLAAIGSSLKGSRAALMVKESIAQVWLLEALVDLLDRLVSIKSDHAGGTVVLEPLVLHQAMSQVITMLWTTIEMLPAEFDAANLRDRAAHILASILVQNTQTQELDGERVLLLSALELFVLLTRRGTSTSHKAVATTTSTARSTSSGSSGSSATASTIQADRALLRTPVDFDDSASDQSSRRQAVPPHSPPKSTKAPSLPSTPQRERRSEQRSSLGYWTPQTHRVDTASQAQHLRRASRMSSMAALLEEDRTASPARLVKSPTIAEFGNDLDIDKQSTLRERSSSSQNLAFLSQDPLPNGLPRAPSARSNLGHRRGQSMGHEMFAGQSAAIRKAGLGIGMPGKPMP